MYTPTVKTGFLLVTTFIAVFVGELLAQNEQQGAGTPPPALPERVPELIIGSGDLLEVSVYGASDFSKIQARVGTDGTITLPLVGTLKIAGLNNHDAEAVIANALSSHRLYN